MEMQKHNQKLIADFIEQIWNQKNFERLDKFIHSDFKDNSLPSNLSPDKEGMKKWIQGTSASFEHLTIIEEQLTESEKSIVKIRMQMKHIGIWRNIQPTGVTVNAAGYRFYRIKDEKIIEHSALIDGHAIENQLK